MCQGIVLIFPAFFPLDREVFWVFCFEIFPHFFVLIKRFFGFFVLFCGEFFCLFFLFYRERGWSFLKELDIESSEYSGTNISGGGASVTSNEALPNIGRQPRRNAKDDRSNLPTLL